jgi:hypothetical protein
VRDNNNVRRWLAASKTARRMRDETTAANRV